MHLLHDFDHDYRLLGRLTAQEINLVESFKSLHSFSHDSFKFLIDIGKLDKGFGLT